MMMLNPKSVILAICLLFPVLGQAEEPTKLVANLEAGKKQVVVVYGTSLTEKGAWVKQIADVLNNQYPGLVTVVNSGGSGMCSKWGVQNFDKRVIGNKPDTVFIEFSINDSVERFQVSVEAAKTNLEAMIASLRESNPECEVILMTMTPGDKYPKGHRSYRKDIEAHYEMYRSVAKREGLLLIDHYPNWKALQVKDKKLFQEYVPDSIHPTAEGCTKVVTPVILDALGIQRAGQIPKRQPEGRASGEPMSVWFTSPATTFRESCPLGNGRLGAMDFGGIDEWRIVLNEACISSLTTRRPTP